MEVDIKKNWALSQLGITMEITMLRGGEYCMYKNLKRKATC